MIEPQAIAIFPGYYDAWALLGKQLWDDKRLDEAVACYRKSVEIFPSYENGNWGLAKTLEESGRTEEARKAFEVAKDRFPDSYPVAYHRAAFLDVHGTLEEAEDAWDDAVENGDGAVSARLAHARVLRKLGREEEAWNEARWALVKDSANGEARRFLAEGYERAGRTVPAGAEWTRAVRSNPQEQVLASELLEYAVRHPETRFRARMRLPLKINLRPSSRPSTRRSRAMVSPLSGSRIGSSTCSSRSLCARTVVWRSPNQLRCSTASGVTRLTLPTSPKPTPLTSALL